MSDHVIHSPSRALPLPAVIRLLRYIRRSYRKSLAFSKKNVFRRDNYTCQYCGRMGSDLTIDHIIPRSLGGKTSWDNVVVACQACNVRKGNRRLDETGMHLLRKVKPPPFVVFLNFPPPSAQAFVKIWQNTYQTIATRPHEVAPACTGSSVFLSVLQTNHEACRRFPLPAGWTAARADVSHGIMWHGWRGSCLCRC